MERSQAAVFEDFASAQLVVPVEVLVGRMKQIAVVVQVQVGSEVVEGLYRPEQGVKLSKDPRIPKPQELYRDVCYHRVDRLLGWKVSLPVVPWSFAPDDRGVLRPYLREAKSVEHFQLINLVRQNTTGFFTHAAILDYICALVDRNCGDILVENGQPFLIDSSLSFVEGDDLNIHSSVIRQCLEGQIINDRDRNQLLSCKETDLSRVFQDLVGAKEISGVCRRIQRLLEIGKII